MPREMPQDVLPPEKKSIRRIPLASAKKNTRTETEIEFEISSNDHRKKAAKILKMPRNLNLSRYGIWIVVLIAVGALVFGVSTFLTGATVTVIPRQKTVAIDLQGLSEKAPTSGLPYDVATLGASQTTYIPSTGSTDVQKKAGGTIVIYNNYSTSPQRLIKNTRFETPDGLIYRIDHSLVIPGMSTKDGKTVPGSVESAVVADEVGPKYNIGMTDFTIPGFKGDKRYTGFYARSKTPMTGGFVGTVPTASIDKLNAAYTAIETNLRKTLMDKLQTQTPEAYILFDTAVHYSYERPQPTTGTSNMVAVTEYATSTAVLYDREAFAMYVAGRVLTEYQKEPLRIANIDSLSFAPQFPTNFQAGDPLQFSLKGPALFVWNFDLPSLQNDLAGQNRSAVADVLAKYTGIEKMEATIRPFWRRAFPGDPRKIKVEEKITYPDGKQTQ